MSNIKLTRLTFVGKDVPAASINFGPNLNVIYGASDTGKSYIVEAIDFMLGRKSLKAIPQAEDYQTILLSLVLPDQTALTLERSITGGQFYARYGDFAAVPDSRPDFNLAAAHGAGTAKKESLSGFLLRHIGLDGRQVRKNQRNETVPLSFRNLCFLSIVDETKMQSTTPPALSGQYTTSTAELSILKLLLQGEDDSDIAQESGTYERRKIARGKAEVLEVVINDLKETLRLAAGPVELTEQLMRLNASIEENTTAIDSILERRTAVASQYSAVVGRSSSYQARLEEVGELLARFSVLRAKYDSDLQRLEMVREAGSLLGFFRPGVCVFCGAPVEHQAAENHSAEEVTAFGESVLAEIQKTTLLREDLVSTISDLQIQEQRLRTDIDSFVVEINRLRRQTAELDDELQPQRVAIQEFLGVRTDVEAKLATYAQIERLEALQATVMPVEQDDPPRPPGVSDRVLAEFSSSIKTILDRWSVPVSGAVRYSKTYNDLLVDDQPRSSRGKGMRAILHASFTVGLAQYCFDRALAHPGFVVLDSPLTTYRQPDPEVGEAPSEAEFASVADAFYRYLDIQFDGQSIIVENTDPPSNLSDDAHLLHFTKRSDAGRYGFFPDRSA
ncbi:AAA family ATPase [Actinoplanes sp. M2I2]|uniref:AAA family ATPase n=1 Tax=Actinoplanes sp. M2I2 TaxID=1734444 RepID=UPI0020219D47|nr:AAA family ATPase [Actinoplanes sp. M2I2]